MSPHRFIEYPLRSFVRSLCLLVAGWLITAPAFPTFAQIQFGPGVAMKYPGDTGSVRWNKAKGDRENFSTRQAARPSRAFAGARCPN